jgi:hypothetical protein
MSSYPGGTVNLAAPGWHVLVYSLHQAVYATVAACSGSYNAWFDAYNFAEQRSLGVWLVMVLMGLCPEGGGHLTLTCWAQLLVYPGGTAAQGQDVGVVPRGYGLASQIQ